MLATSLRVSPTLFALLFAGILACAAPGVDIARQPGDFAFLQVDLLG